MAPLRDGELVQGIAAQKPRAIVFDILFFEPDVYQLDADELFNKAASPHMNVFFPTARLDAAANPYGVPLVPGIMPINKFAQLARFSDNCGAEIPRWIRKKLEGFGDDTASIRAFGLDVVTQLCDHLLSSGAPGLHFYTLNQAGLTTTIWQRLGL